MEKALDPVALRIDLVHDASDVAPVGKTHEDAVKSGRPAPSRP